MTLMQVRSIGGFADAAKALLANFWRNVLRARRTNGSLRAKSPIDHEFSKLFAGLESRECVAPFRRIKRAINRRCDRAGAEERNNLAELVHIAHC